MIIVRQISDYNGLPDRVRNLLDLFSTMGIETRTFCHPQIFTVEQGIQLSLPAEIPGQHGKSLFLTDGRGGLWLVVAREDRRVDLKRLASTLGIKRFSFATPALMQEILGVTPGSVTPFAVVNDTSRRVTLVIDCEFAGGDTVFHPLDNGYSTIIGFEDLLKFVQGHGYTPHLLALA